MRDTSGDVTLCTAVLQVWLVAQMQIAKFLRQKITVLASADTHWLIQGKKK